MARIVAVRRVLTRATQEAHSRMPNRSCRESAFGRNTSNYRSRQQELPSVQGGVSQRSSLPQQVRPACRIVSPLNTNGAEINFFNEEPPQSGQVTGVPDRTSAAKVELQLRQRYS